MKPANHLLPALAILAIATPLLSMPISSEVWINEFHYDNLGTDTGEFVEIAGVAGTNLDAFNIILYNGNGGVSYNTISLAGSAIPDEGLGYGALAFSLPTNGLQNGPDGIALVNSVETLQFLSYEGSFTATNGEAIGLDSMDIGASETNATPIGSSLQLVGSGSRYEDFTWTNVLPSSAGSLNSEQIISAPILSEEPSHVSDTGSAFCLLALSLFGLLGFNRGRAIIIPLAVPAHINSK